MKLEYNDCIFNRDESENLIPISDVLNFGKKKINGKLEEVTLNIKFIPVTRSKFYELQNKKEMGEATEKDVDKQIVRDNLIEPKFSDKDIDNMRTSIFSSIVTRIMSRSFGVTDIEFNTPEDKEELDDLKKKV